MSMKMFEKSSQLVTSVPSYDVISASDCRRSLHDEPSMNGSDSDTITLSSGRRCFLYDRTIGASDPKYNDSRLDRDTTFEHKKQHLLTKSYHELYNEVDQLRMNQKMRYAQQVNDEDKAVVAQTPSVNSAKKTKGRHDELPHLWVDKYAPQSFSQVSFKALSYDNLPRA